MKKYTKILAVIMLNFVSLNIHTVDNDNALSTLRLLQEADQMASQLLNLALQEAKEEAKEEQPPLEPSPDLSAQNKAIIEEFMQSTKDTYISNLQTLIVNNNFHAGAEVYNEAEIFGINLLKSHIKDDTKWSGFTGNTLSLGDNPHGMTLSQLKELIAATMIVFNDPICQFESNGAFTNNKANRMKLSEFLVKHLSVDKAKVSSIQSQAVSMPKITNLDALAATINN